MTHCTRHEEYISPFSARYSSPEMSSLFSARAKAILFRKLWVSLAKAQKKLGLPISDPQINEMQAAVNDIDFEKINEYEKKLRHDVMAHIHAFGDACPMARSIIHLGATSSYVTDNADLIQLKEGLSLLFQKLLHVVKKLSDLAEKHAHDPCLSYTHFQPAQPTTIGKRICLWLQDFLLDAHEWHRLIEDLPFLGAKGATGTQASFFALFEKENSRNVSYTIPGSNIRTAINITFYHKCPALILCSNLFNYRGNHSARATPFSPKINKYRLI